MTTEMQAPATEAKAPPAPRPRGSGRIFQRKGSACWWIAYYLRGKEIRESSESENWKDAEKLLKHRLKEVGADQLGARRFIGPTPERVDMGELFDALESDLKLQGKFAPPTQSHLKLIREAFGALKALAVTTERIDRYIEERLAPRTDGAHTLPGAAPSTVNRETQLLHRAFRLAVDRNRLAFMPRVRRLSEAGNVRRGFFEREEFEALCARLPGYLQDFTRFAFVTGWRKGEIAALTWADVDGQAVRLRAEDSKNRHGRSVPLEGELRALIERRRVARHYTDKDGNPAVSLYVFHQGDGRAIRDFRKSWRVACKAAGVSGRLFHDLRRTAVRNLVRAGAPETVAMAISGHRTRAIFDRYNIASEKDIREALQRTLAHMAQPAGNVTPLPAAAQARMKRRALRLQQNTDRTRTVIQA
jgi:integrase